MFEQLKEGWQYVSNFVPIRTILLLFALVSLMGMPYVVLMPVFSLRRCCMAARTHWAS